MLQNILTLTSILGVFASAFAEEKRLPADEHFEVETVATGLVDAMEIAPTNDGRVFIVERTGSVKLFDPKDGSTKTIATIEVEVRNDSHAREAGLLGITLDPEFDYNQWLYLFYSAPEKPVQRLAKFTFKNEKLANETLILEFEHDRENAVCHEGGSLTFGPNGNLFLSTGDNTCPFKSNGSAPIDERQGHHEFDAQRSAGNTNDLRGKILRVRPKPEGGYDIPDGNLFAEGTPNTRPEIYAMGCRNPFRMSVDSATGFVYWGEVGPDAGDDTDRGSSGFDEINQAKKAGNFGWPYFVADNKAYTDFNFKNNRLGSPFSWEKPLNNSPNSTGLKSLPAATKPLWFYPRASACAGPVYHVENFPQNPGRLPAELDNCLLVYDWTSAWIRAIKLDEQGGIVWNEPWLSRHLFVHPVDMETGAQGEIYLLEYGSGWYDSADGTLKKITYSETPISIDLSAADPRMKGLDLDHPGSKMIAKTTCLACHMTEQKSIGPTYQDVAKKYRKDPEARDRLAQKILLGGMGAWGEVPMPPHPQHNIEETQQMIDAILSINAGGEKAE
ncbi:PQQ-dependent sugar dehydrogenase [Verrucomicrobiales bacterium]|nr:PQQ-dependent sugar dehydrogenase [Verrucomicrobiales bacterium]